jgi:thiamine-phosphate pyrophosphorylase
VSLPDPPILIITDRRRSVGALDDRVLALFRGGCRWLSVREKDLAAAERLDLLGRLVELGRDFGATLSVHDDAAAAATLGVGLHLPAKADGAAARRRLGRALIGQSCHDATELAAAVASGVDYATLSPVFASAGKPGYHPVLGLDSLARAAPIPVLALGGVTIATASGLAGRGFAGAAVMGEAMTTPDPQTWMARLALLCPAPR